jgi:hypothetical protein
VQLLNLQLVKLRQSLLTLFLSDEGMEVLYFLLDLKPKLLLQKLSLRLIQEMTT